MSCTQPRDPFPHHQLIVSHPGKISPGSAVELSVAHYPSPAELFREAAEAKDTGRRNSALPQHFMLASVTANWWLSMPGRIASTRVHIFGYVASHSLPGLGPVPGSVLGSPQNKEQLCSTGLVHEIEPRSSLCSPENTHCSDF